jgi:hypothetical protein
MFGTCVMVGWFRTSRERATKSAATAVPRCKVARRLQIGGTCVCMDRGQLHRLAPHFLPDFYPVPATTPRGSRSCAATVYGPCADKALPHVRILNTIRIAPKDLETFIAARRVGRETGRIAKVSSTRFRTTWLIR